MSTNFPVSLDDGTSLPNPSANSAPNSPSHSSLHSNANDSIKAVEAKVGTGASTPTSNTFLVGNGTGSSAWSGLTSAQLAARLSDETGSGAAVFSNAPTLTTPQVDTINESTPANGVTVDGLNIKDGKLNTNNSVVSANITDGTIVTGDIATNGVGAVNLATNAITLGYAERTSDFVTNSTSVTDVTSLSVAVTVPAGGRRCKITAFIPYITASGGGNATTISIREGSTTLTNVRSNNPAGASTSIASPVYSAVLSAGAHTYKVSMVNDVASNTEIKAAATSPAFILVEAI